MTHSNEFEIDFVPLRNATANDNEFQIDKRRLYQDMKALPVNLRCEVPEEIQSLAAELFHNDLTRMPAYKKRGKEDQKAAEKIDYVGRTLLALKKAAASDMCVRYPRNKSAAGYRDIYLQMIKCMDQFGLVQNIVSPSGWSDCQSRLLARERLLALLNRGRTRPPNAWSVNPERMKYYVQVREKHTKRSLRVDKKNPVAVRTQEVLTASNFINSLYRITYLPLKGTERVQLIPVQYRVFQDTFELHGRIYTAGLGHQHIRREERLSITFELDRVENAVEFDFSSFFTMMCYHLKGMAYEGDPYQLKGEATTDSERFIFKQVMNRALNCEAREDAIDGLKEGVRLMTGQPGKRRYKSPTEVREARELKHYYDQCDLSWEQIYDLMLKEHAAIADCFCGSKGLELMRVESDIMIDLLEHFAARRLPLLSVHDSALTVESAAQELEKMMIKFYERRLGFSPKLKRAVPDHLMLAA